MTAHAKSDLDPNQVDWDKGRGLVPAIVQHADTGTVLMLGYMNEEALRRTRESGWVTFYSRSRQQLWCKGETSGNSLRLAGAHLDCDQDTLLVRAHPTGPVCHTGAKTCFPDDPGLGNPDSDTNARYRILEELTTLIAARADQSAGGTATGYTGRLLQQGTAAVAQKVGEEAVEVALAAVVESDPALIAEAADLLFHLQVLLASRDLSLTDVCRELEQRRQASV